MSLAFAIFAVFYGIFGYAHVWNELSIARQHNEVPPLWKLLWQVPLVFLLWPLGVRARAMKIW